MQGFFRLIGGDEICIVNDTVFVVVGTVAKKQHIAERFIALPDIIKHFDKIADGSNILNTRRKFIVNFFRIYHYGG